MDSSSDLDSEDFPDLPERAEMERDDSLTTAPIVVRRRVVDHDMSKPLFMTSLPAEVTPPKSIGFPVLQMAVITRIMADKAKKEDDEKEQTSLPPDHTVVPPGPPTALFGESRRSSRKARKTEKWMTSTDEHCPSPAVSA
jgi:hypothetical protein